MENILLFELFENACDDALLGNVPQYLGLVICTDIDVAPPTLHLFLVQSDSKFYDGGLS